MLAVAGGKGGTGKSTTAIGLAVALAGRRRRPVTVDADADMPDLAVATGVAATPGIAAIAAGEPLEDVVHSTDRWPCVGVVPARPGAPVERALPRFPDDRWVILDCPGGAASDAVAPLRAADRVVLVTTPDRASVSDVLKTAAMAEALGTPVGAVVTTRAAAVPDGLRERTGAAVGVAVPETDAAPLGDRRVLASYRRLAASLERSPDFCDVGKG